MPTRRRRHSLIALLILAALLAVTLTAAGCEETPVEPPPDPGPGTIDSSVPPPPGRIAFEEVVGGFDQPLYVTGAGDGSERLFVLEKSGRVWIVRGNERGEVFLDLSEVVSTESEQGLLGIAFSPRFTTDGTFFVSYTRADGTSVLSRFTANGDTADPGSEKVLLTVEQPAKNHNGGMIAFGPDRYLYYGLGDGGGAGDPGGHGQNPATLLGTIMRLDVTSEAAGDGYVVPADNPFVGRDGYRPEIWAWGLRNPWRFSFDRSTGDLWIGDVGQGAWEEIDFQSAASTGGENYGWNLYEGTHPYPPGAAEPADPSRFVMPVLEYDRDAGKSVTGGYVYRGELIEELKDTYVYGDFVDGRIWGLTRMPDGSLSDRLLAETPYRISSFGEDDSGELYVVDFAGAVYRIVVE